MRTQYFKHDQNALQRLKHHQELRSIPVLPFSSRRTSRCCATPDAATEDGWNPCGPPPGQRTTELRGTG